MLFHSVGLLIPCGTQHHLWTAQRKKQPRNGATTSPKRPELLLLNHKIPCCLLGLDTEYRWREGEKVEGQPQTRLYQWTTKFQRPFFPVRPVSPHVEATNQHPPRNHRHWPNDTANRALAADWLLPTTTVPPHQARGQPFSMKAAPNTS